MQFELITKQDLQMLRHQIVEDLQALLSVKTESQPAWLKSSEVRKNAENFTRHFTEPENFRGAEPI